jgi:site-specific recombinase XerD
MSIKISYSFILKPSTNRENHYPIYMRAFMYGQKIELATSVNIKQNDWSQKHQRVKKCNASHDKFNQILNAFDRKALKIILNNFLDDDGGRLTLKEFKNRMQNGSANQESFLEYMKCHLEENRTRLSIASYWSYKSQISKLKKFKEEIAFADLSERFVMEYQQFMQTRLKNNPNTISKSLRTLRTFINIAVRYDKVKNNPFQYITVKKVEGQREFLTIIELEVLSEHCFNAPDLKIIERRILQYFLFGCYTGLRYSDLRQLKIGDIKGDSIFISTKKTSQNVVIPLTKRAKHLLPVDYLELPPSNSLFDVYCNKVTNRYLKQMASKFGIQKNLTCHVARHTFATTSITLGIPIEVVSKILGHTSLKTTQIYAKIVDSVKDREMAKWDNY